MVLLSSKVNRHLSYNSVNAIITDLYIVFMNIENAQETFAGEILQVLIYF